MEVATSQMIRVKCCRSFGRESTFGRKFLSCFTLSRYQYPFHSLYAPQGAEAEGRRNE